LSVVVALVVDKTVCLHLSLAVLADKAMGQPEQTQVAQQERSTEGTVATARTTQTGTPAITHSWAAVEVVAEEVRIRLAA
jgi:hypothetical protein